MADQPDLSSVPVYSSFINEHDTYERYHILLMGVQAVEGGDGKIAKRRNSLGMPRRVDAIADPYVTVETDGDDTGSTDYFPIGKHKFATLDDCRTPLWDAKCTLIAKKDTTSGIKFQMYDENSKAADELLLEFTLDRSELPEATSVNDAKWIDFEKTGGEGDKRVSADRMVFCFSVMVTDCADRIVTQQDTEDMYQDSDLWDYQEEVVPDDTEDDEDNALLQCWRQKEDNGGNPPKAVLWIIGRGDCFMHMHVARKLLFESNYDLYVLNYKQNGQCRKHGFVHDAHYVSHNKHGTFDVYMNDISKAIDIINGSKEYDKLLGYAHSTGGPVLINYLIEKGDDEFDGFVFNSPFLDWGHVGGDMVEFVLENVGFMEGMTGAVSHDMKLNTPEETPTSDVDDTITGPIEYLNENIALGAWGCKLWSLYYHDWGSRPLYKMPCTVGFAKGVTQVHRKMESLHEEKRVVTAKPFLVITSRGDDVLVVSETLERSDWIGPNRSEIELNDNAHDVFLSQDLDDTNTAIDMVAVWMKYKKF